MLGLKLNHVSKRGHRGLLMAHYRVQSTYNSSTVDVVYEHEHYSDVIMGMIASQITSLTIVYTTVYSGADQRKHQSSASLAFVQGIHRRPVNFPHKWPVTRKMFPFDDVIVNTSRPNNIGWVGSNFNENSPYMYVISITVFIMVNMHGTCIETCYLCFNFSTALNMKLGVYRIRGPFPWCAVSEIFVLCASILISYVDRGLCDELVCAKVKYLSGLTTVWSNMTMATSG